MPDFSPSVAVPFSRIRLRFLPWNALCRWLAGIVVLAFIAADDVAAQETPRVELGIAGTVKVGVWSEAKVSTGPLGQTGGTVRVLAADPVGQTATFSQIVSQEALSAGEVTLPFIVGRLGSTVTVEWWQDDQAVDRLVIRPTGDDQVAYRLLRQDVQVLVHVGNESQFPWDDEAARESFDVELIRFSSSEAIPRTRDGLAAVDVLVATDVSAWDDERSALVNDWVGSGGHLVIVQSAEAGAPEEYAFTREFPLSGGEPQSLRDFSSLENYAGQAARIPFRGSVSATPWQLTDGISLAATREVTLVGRTLLGFGQLTLCSLPLDRPPLSRWEGRQGLTQRLVDLSRARQRVSEQRAGSQQLGHVGVSDLASQLHAAIDQFPQVRRPSIQMALVLMFLFALISFPLDYLLVHKVLKRPEATWITFPVLVLAVSAGAIWMGRTGNGDQQLIRRTAAIDFDVRSGRVRYNDWESIYSPETARFRIEPRVDDWLRPSGANAGIEREALAWTGIPENTFGGMYREQGTEFGTTEYAIERNPPRIEGLPIQVWSTRMFHHQYDAAGVQLFESQLTSRASGRLDGTLRHGLPGPISDWMLAFGNRVYRPTEEAETLGSARIEPNGWFSPNDPGVYQRELRGYLRRLRALRSVGEAERRGDILIEQEEYDAATIDLNLLWRMMTFHSVAGGESYTGLKHVSLGDLEMSRALELGMAVLFARLDAPAGELTVNGEPVERDGEVFVRVILPVTTTGEVLRELPKFDD